MFANLKASGDYAILWVVVFVLGAVISSVMFFGFDLVIGILQERGTVVSIGSRNSVGLGFWMIGLIAMSFSVTMSVKRFFGS